jgi:CheY-like chemotaxis protein
MILIQHEDETVREFASFMLTSAGYECRWATSPTEAWDILRSEEAVELLLCKVMESLEDGLIERVVERFPDIPVVVCPSRVLGGGFVSQTRLRWSGLWRPSR